MSNRRRYTIIIISVFIGSVFAALLFMSRNRKLSPNEWGTLAINFFFALAIVFAIGILLSRKPK